MIFPIALIATLFLTQIARAVPQACYYPTSPEPSTPEEQFLVTAPIYTAKHDKEFDKADQSVTEVACSEFAGRFPTFEDFPFFPYIGGAYETTKNSSHCGAVWKIANKDNSSRWIHFISIDNAVGDSFSLSGAAYYQLGGTQTESLGVKATLVGHLTVTN